MRTLLLIILLHILELTPPLNNTITSEPQGILYPMSTSPSLSGLSEGLQNAVFDKDVNKFIEDEKANNRMFTKA